MANQWAPEAFLPDATLATIIDAIRGANLDPSTEAHAIRQAIENYKLPEEELPPPDEEPVPSATLANLMNIPYGADYYPSQVSGLLGILGLQQAGRQFGLTFPEQQRQFGLTLGQQQRQFETQAQLNAARTLSSLRAQGPSSEAELALFRQALGIPTGIPGEVSFEDILGMQPQRAGIAPAGGFAGTRVNLPLGGTLTGSQFARAARSPSGAGRLVSFAKAAGDPTLLERTAGALLPTGFRGVGTGL